MGNKKIQNAADISILLTITNTFATGLSILLAAIGVRYLSKMSYGIYLQIMFLMNTTLMIMEFGMPKSIYYFIPRVINKRKFVFHTLMMLNAVGMLGLLIFWLGRNKISIILNNNEIVYALWFLGIYIFFSTNRIIFASVLLSNNRGKNLVVIRAIMSILQFFVVGMPMILSLGLKGVLWGLFIYHFIQYMVTGFVSLKVAEGTLSELRKSECFIEQLRFMVPLGLISLLSIFTASIDRFIITILLGIDNFAIYDRGAIKIPLIGTLSITVGAVILPKIVEYYKTGQINKLLNIWHSSIEKVALVVFPCFVFLLFFAKEVITLLYTEKFEASIIIFRIYLFCLLPTIAVYGNIFNAANKNKQFLIITIFVACIQAPLCVVMVKIFGNSGPALGTVIVYVILFMITIKSIKKILKVKMKNVFPWIFLLKILSIAIISGSITWIIRNLINQKDIITIIVCFPIFILFYYFMANKTNLIKNEDRDILKKWVGFNWFKKRIIKIVNGAKA